MQLLAHHPESPLCCQVDPVAPLRHTPPIPRLSAPWAPRDSLLCDFWCLPRCRGPHTGLRPPRLCLPSSLGSLFLCWLFNCGCQCASPPPCSPSSFLQEFLPPPSQPPSLHSISLFLNHSIYPTIYPSIHLLPPCTTASLPPSTSSITASIPPSVPPSIYLLPPES